MAHKRASILTTGLEDLHAPIPPIRDHRSPVEAPERPESTSGETILDGFSSLRRNGKRDRLVPYPIRLAQTQIDDLEELREQRGIIPAEFIRDAVASCLALLHKS